MNDPILRQIVDRCHVGQSNRAVIRYVVSRLKKGYATWMILSRSVRRGIMRDAIAMHAENRILYRSVMGGRL